MTYIDYYIEKDLYRIFRNHNINKLTHMQKRYLIFSYLCDNIEYNWSLYLQIFKSELTFKLTHTRKVQTYRNNQKELIDTITHHKGICNSISEYYKLLLARVGIFSSVVITDNNQITKHALNIVYNESKDTYTLDDITSVIALHWSKKKSFNYTLKDAHKYNQGTKSLFKTKDEKWFIIPSSWIYGFIEETPSIEEVEIERHINTNLPDILNKKRKIHRKSLTKKEC